MDSTEQSDEDKRAVSFTELFRVASFSGNLNDLVEGVNAIHGVGSVSTPTRKWQVVEDAEVTFEITYDAYETDRTRISNQIEEIEGVEEDVILA